MANTWILHVFGVNALKRVNSVLLRVAKNMVNLKLFISERVGGKSCV